MQTSAGARKSSYKELFLINKSTYFALLQKLTPLEKSDIERMNKQTLIPEEDNMGMSANKPASGTDSEPVSTLSAPTDNTPANLSDQSASVPLNTNTASDVFDGNDEDTEPQNAAENNDTEDNDVQQPQNNLEADLAEARAPDIPLAVDNNDNDVPPLPEKPPTPVPAPTPEPVAPPTLPGPPLPPIPKGKKGRHHMPHVVTLRHTPETLVTQVHGTTATTPHSTAHSSSSSSSSSSNSVKTTATNDTTLPKKAPSPKLGSDKKKLHKCKECGAEFKADWRLFKHITSVHDASEYAKEAILSRENTIQANRSKLRSSQRLREKKAMSTSTDKADINTGESSKSDNVSATETHPKASQKTTGTLSKATKTSRKVKADPYPKTKPTKTSKKPKAEVKAMDQAPPDLVRSSTAAGKKRSISVKVNQSSAPKKKSGTLAVSAPSNRAPKRAKSSMFVSTLKRPRLDDSDDDSDEGFETTKNRKTKKNKRYGADDSDDEYDAWKY